jgi:ABC-type Mn2+/Zn2+ transport system permease subunit
LNFSFLTEPLLSGFFARGLVAALLVMAGGGVLGFGVLTRRFAYLGQGISQSMLAGVAIGSILGLNSNIAAFAGALMAAGLIATLARVRGLGSDASVAIVASMMMSIGVAIISINRSRAVNLNNLLFGNVLGASWGEVLLLGIFVTLASTFALTQGRRLALAAINPAVAEAHGIKVGRIEFYRLVTLTMITAGSVQIVGVTLVVAALVLPSAIASLFSRTLGGLHMLAITAGIMMGVIGLYLSFWYDIPSGPAVVITGTLFYIFSLVVRVIFKQG